MTDNLHIKVCSSDHWPARWCRKSKHVIRAIRHHNALNDDGCMHRLLHHRHCISDIWYSCTHRSGRRAVVITDARRVKRYSGDISHKQIIALSLFTRRPTHRWPQLQCPGQLSQRWILQMSLSLTSCTVEQCRREHGVAST